MTEPMTRRDREDLAKVARMRSRVAKAQVAERERTLLADVEAQLSATYKFGDKAWSQVTATAEAAVTKANAQVAVVCEELGIPSEFSPSLQIAWYGRGENAMASRRAELRKAAAARIAAAGQSAKVAIEARTAEVVTELVAGGLESGAARAFLETIPTPEQLMPQIAIAELEPGEGLSGWRQRRALSGL